MPNQPVDGNKTIEETYITPGIKLQGNYTLVPSKFCKCIFRIGKLIEGWSHLQCKRCKRPINGICITYSGTVYSNPNQK